MGERPQGLDGVEIDATAVGEVRAGEGTYRYREHDAIAVARSRPFEDVLALLVDGALPGTAAEAARAHARLAAARRVPVEVIDALDQVVALRRPAATELDETRSIVAELQAALALLGVATDQRALRDLDPPARRDAVVALCGALPTLVAALHRRRAGLAVLAPDPTLSHAADLLRMVTGVEPTADDAAALDAYLVVAADHGFNVSTFAARVVASSGSDASAAFLGALAAFGGALHGGAPTEALSMLDEIGSPSRAEPWVRDRLTNRERIAGFGHRLYRTDDPRAVHLRALVAERGDPRGQVAVAVEDAVGRLLPEIRPGQVLRVNLELYAGVLLESAGLPRSLITPTFAVARSAGWAAHVVEQVETGRLYRPVGRYLGPDVARPLPVLE